MHAKLGAFPYRHELHYGRIQSKGENVWRLEARLLTLLKHYNGLRIFLLNRPQQPSWILRECEHTCVWFSLKKERGWGREREKPAPSVIKLVRA